MKRAPKDFDDGRMTTGQVLVVGACLLITVALCCWALWDALVQATKVMP